MPSEERYIAFSDAEAAAALEGFVRKRDAGWGRVAIREVKRLVDGDVLTGVRPTGIMGHERVGIDLNRAQLTAALLAACFSRKIPIPRRADKGVILADDRVTLVLEIGLNTHVAVNQRQPILREAARMRARHGPRAASATYLDGL